MVQGYGWVFWKHTLWLTWKDSIYRAKDWVITKVVAAALLDADSCRCLWFGAALQRAFLLLKEVVYSPSGTGRLFSIREHLWCVFEVNSGKSVHISAMVCHLHHMGSSANMFFFFNLKLAAWFLPHQSALFGLKGFHLGSYQYPATSRSP